MSDLSLGNLFIAILVGFPGYISLKILNTYAFGNIRFHSSKVATFIISIVLSLGLLLAADAIFFYFELADNIKNYFFECDPRLLTRQCKIIETVQLDGILSLFIKNAVLSGTVEEISFLIKYAVLPVLLWSIAVSSVLAWFFYIARKLVYLDMKESKDIVLLWFLYFLSKWLKTSYRPYSVDMKVMLPIIEEESISVKIVLREIFFVLIPLGLFLIFFRIWGACEIGLRFLTKSIRKVITVFRHPYEGLFDTREHKSICGIPILEIKSGGHVINKGVYRGFLTTDSDDFESISISSVIQYYKKNNSGDFSRDNRKVYVFPNQHSTLTVLSSEAQDFNFFYLTLENFDYDFDLRNNEDVKNIIWYMDLLLAKFPARFELRKMNIVLSHSTSVIFFDELAKLILKHYDRRLLQLHFFRIYHDYLISLREYRNAARGQKLKVSLEQSANYQKLKERALVLRKN